MYSHKQDKNPDIDEENWLKTKFVIMFVSTVTGRIFGNINKPLSFSSEVITTYHI